MIKIEDKTAFRANQNLRKYDTQIEYDDWQILEINKCQDDPIYFIEKYCKIVSLDYGLVNFQLYDYQRNYITALHNNYRVITKWPRQSGKTITTAAYIIWYIIFSEYKTVGILAHQMDGAQEILSRVQDMYELLPIWLQAGVCEWNKRSVELDNGCKIIVAPTKSTKIRGRSVGFLFLDECGFIPNSEFDTFFASVYPTIASSKEAKIVISSTPNGLNHFYILCKDAISGKSGYIFSEINWYDVPGRDENFKIKTIAEIGIDRWCQEFECHFAGASGAIIKSESLQLQPTKQPILKKFDDAFRIYTEPKAGRTYVAICDVAEGVGRDSSTIQVIDISAFPYEQAATFQSNKIKSNLFHIPISQIGTAYNNALVIVESNAIGREVLNNLFYDTEYENIYIEDSTKESGMRTTRTIKNVGSSELKHLIESGFMILHDFETVAELSNFIRHADGKIAAKKDHHDDLVMPLVLFGYFTGNKKLFNKWFETLENSEINIGVIQKMNEEILPVAWISDGHGIVAMDDSVDDFGCFTNSKW